MYGEVFTPEKRVQEQSENQAKPQRSLFFINFFFLLFFELLFLGSESGYLLIFFRVAHEESMEHGHHPLPPCAHHLKLGTNK